MKRTPLAAAITAVFLISASSLFAQTSGYGTAGTSGSSATGSGGGAPATTSSTPSSRSATGTYPNTSTTTPGTASTPPSATSSPPSTASTTAPPSASTSSMSGTAKLAHRDRKFIEKAAEDGIKEVEFAKLAAQKASDPAVKSFAEQMVKDHSDANQKLMTVAQSKGITLPAALKRSDERQLRKLEKLEGAKFDKMFVKDMVKDHKKDAKEFDKEAKKAKDADVKQFAADAAPVIHRHLDAVNDLNRNMGRGGSATTGMAPSGTTGGSTAGTSGLTPSTSSSMSSGAAPSSSTTASATGSTSSGK